MADSGINRANIAAIWLCLVAVATVLNSLIVFKHRFIDLFIGLSFTQFIDAIFVGMQLEPPGAPWLYTALPALALDMPFVLVLLVLAVKVSHRRYRATQVSFWLYAIDTCVFVVTLTLNAVTFHAATKAVALESLTVLAHFVGLIILFRARRMMVSEPASA